MIIGVSVKGAKEILTSRFGLSCWKRVMRDCTASGQWSGVRWRTREASCGQEYKSICSGHIPHHENNSICSGHIPHHEKKAAVQVTFCTVRTKASVLVTFPIMRTASVQVTFPIMRRKQLFRSHSALWEQKHLFWSHSPSRKQKYLFKSHSPSWEQRHLFGSHSHHENKSIHSGHVQQIILTLSGSNPGAVSSKTRAHLQGWM